MDDDLETLRRLNDDYIRSVQHGDVKRFGEILAEDFLASNPDGSLVDRHGFGGHPRAHLVRHRGRARRLRSLHRHLGAPRRPLARGCRARHARLSGRY